MTVQLAIPAATRIGWIGTGVMGSSMCGHLLTAGYRVTVHSRTRSKAQPLLDRGAQWAESPRAVVTESDVLFTMVGFPQDVRQVYFGTDGILSGAGAGTILIDMTTTQPSLSREIAAAASAKNLSAIDAPVSGGDVGAKNAALSIMIGGDTKSVQAVMPLFELLGKKIVHQGEPGTGQQAKLCNQIVIAGTMVGVCESLLYGYKAGLDLNRMLESIRGGAAACWTLDNLAPRILQPTSTQDFLSSTSSRTWASHWRRRNVWGSYCPVSRWCTSSTRPSKRSDMAVVEPTR